MSTQTVFSFALSEIGQIAINVRDLKRATTFYRDTLGMRFLFDAANLAFFDCGGVRLMLGTPEQPQFDHPASVIYYRVADLEQAYQLLKGRGVQFQGAPHLIARLPDHELWMAFLRDSENNLLALMSEVGKG
ncbi:MAG TPA: VOC family protein [Terriglobales bacterium]|nr:VOC family protein [Terriglobales bacterium]